MVEKAIPFLEGEIIREGEAGINEQIYEAYEEFRDSAASLKDEMVLRVYEVPSDREGNPLTGKEGELLFTAPIDRYNFEEALQRYQSEFMEPGKLRAIVRLMVFQRGQRGCKFQKLVIVRGARKVEGDNSSGISGELLNTMKSMQSDQRALFERMLQGAEARHVQPKDPMESIARMVQVCTPLVAALVPMFQNRGTDPVTMFTQLAAVLKDTNQKPSESIGEQIKTLALLKDLAGGLGGGESDEGVGGIIKGVSPLVAPFMQVLAANAQRDAALAARAPPRVRVLPQQNPAPPPAAQAPPGEPVAPIQPIVKEDDEMNLLELRDQLGALADMAKDGGDAKLIADMFMEQVPDDMDDKLYNLLSHPQCIERMVAAQPKVAEHREWFEVLRTAMLAAYDDPDAPQT